MVVDINWTGIIPVLLSIGSLGFSRWNQISDTAEKYKEPLKLTRQSIAVELETKLTSFLEDVKKYSNNDKGAFFDTAIIEHRDVFEKLLEEMIFWKNLDNEIIKFKERMKRLIDYNLLAIISTIILSGVWMIFDIFNTLFWKKNIVSAFISITYIYFLLGGIFTQAYFLYLIHQEPINKELEWEKIIKNRKIK